jgi:hypothetical protein
MAILENIRDDLRQKAEKYITIQHHSFTNSDPYAVWKAIKTCEVSGIPYPSWVREEIERISFEILEFKNPDGRYPEHIAEILKLKDGKKHLRRAAERRQRNAKIRLEAGRLYSDGWERKDILENLSGRFDNAKDVETMVDKEIRFIRSFEEDERL